MKMMFFGGKVKVLQRPAVQRGRKVNRTWGELSDQLHERHDATDFDLKTQDKLAPPSTTWNVCAKWTKTMLLDTPICDFGWLLRTSLLRPPMAGVTP